MRRWLTTLRHKLLGQPFRDLRYESSAYFFVLNPFELILDFVSRILDKNSKIEKVNSKRNYYSISSKSLFICKIEWCADPLKYNNFSPRTPTQICWIGLTLNYRFFIRLDMCEIRLNRKAVENSKTQILAQNQNFHCQKISSGITLFIKFWVEVPTTKSQNRNGLVPKRFLS